MLTGWRYRIGSVAGVTVLAASAFLIANHPVAQQFFTSVVPLFNRLEPTVLEGESFWLALVLSVGFIVGSLWPLYKPQPHRILYIVYYAQKRIIAGGLALAALGYFEWSHRLPRATLTILVGVLLFSVPLWFVTIRHRPSMTPGRALIVGDDPEQITQIASTVDTPLVGYLSPSVLAASGDRSPIRSDGGAAVSASQPTSTSDSGSADLERIGGLSRLNDVIVNRDIETVILAFSQSDRGDFFGALDTCHQHGVDAKVHREYADDVLTASGDVETLVDVDVQPLDLQEYVFKRAFDLAFAGFGLLALSPVIVLIAVAIKLDSSGPVLYSQERTAGFGERFSAYKFRSMIPDAEAETGAIISAEDNGDVDPRVTRVGRFLRRTHMDEIPQLWSILVGDMSVVGPRPERPTIDTDIQDNDINWSKRWFIKPGLTGLAQINEATGHEPARKLRYDVKYIRTQSFMTDLAIVIRQIWMVVVDFITVLKGHDPEATEADE